RHVERHPTLPVLYVINELGNTIDVLERNADSRMRILQTVSTLPEGFDGASTTSEIIVSADGRFVYGSNRGHDSIVSFAVDAAGRLSEPEYASTRGEHPRFFTVDPSGAWLLAANQSSDNVVVFALDKGRPGDVVCETDVPKPVCLLFLN
ncbi:MAG: beta-propeller fold lactonase family protein, partial [Gammaproteobacteria bacterium]|nr:beta-propeller fold lactonase family protein [Gammaproteobacteria bacterium]